MEVQRRSSWLKEMCSTGARLNCHFLDVRMFQASWGRSGKEQQGQNSSNLEMTVLPTPLTDSIPFRSQLSFSFISPETILSCERLVSDLLSGFSLGPYFYDVCTEGIYGHHEFDLVNTMLVKLKKINLPLIHCVSYIMSFKWHLYGEEGSYQKVNRCSFISPRLRKWPGNCWIKHLYHIFKTTEI